MANCLCAHGMVILLFISRAVQRVKNEINTKITLEWTHKQFVTRVHKSFFLLHDINNPYMTLKTRIFTHHPRGLNHSPYVLLMTSQSIGDDVKMTRQLWRENVTSNSLVDFIHGDIQGRWCKNVLYPQSDFLYYHSKDNRHSSPQYMC